MMNDVVIVSAKRTPIGTFNGVFAGTSATEPGKHAAVAALAAVAPLRNNPALLSFL